MYGSNTFFGKGRFESGFDAFNSFIFQVTCISISMALRFQQENKDGQQQTELTIL